MIDIKASDYIMVRVYDTVDVIAVIDETGQVAAVAINEIDELIQALSKAKAIIIERQEK